MNKYRFFITIFILLALFSGCDEGLKPPQQIKSYLKGTIYYIGGKDNWPPADSVQEIRVVAFKNYPPGDILSEIINNNAYFTLDPLPTFVDKSDFSIEIHNPPVTIKYLVCALRYGNILEWKAIGFLKSKIDTTQPEQIEVKQNEVIDSLIIYVDFKNLPPQPFK